MNLNEVAWIVRSELVEIHSTESGYRAEIKDVETKCGERGRCLSSTMGRGKTAIEARENLAEELKGVTLVKNALKANRWEVTLPFTISV